jgi:hypothetical protein
MPLAVFDFKVTGLAEVNRMLAKLPDNVQKNVVAQAERKSSRRLIAKIADAADRLFVDGTGKLAAALRALKPKTRRTRGAVSVLGFLPTRAALGIAEKGGGYYPTAQEYGFRHAGSGKFIQPKSYIRATVNANQDAETATMAKDIGVGIEKEAKKLLGKAGR